MNLPAHVRRVVPKEHVTATTPWSQLDVGSWRARVLSEGFSAEDGVRAAIARIDELNGIYNAVSWFDPRGALEEARRLDKQLASQTQAKSAGPLHGVPLLIKDEVDVKGAPTTFGTAANPSPKAADSELVTRLRAAGAIILGKTTMPAFGAFPFTESEAFGVTRNPWDPTRTPGGSSGGSAVAVATGMVPAAIGGDGGGSIRIPSAHCGLTGLKPARGSVPPAPYKDLWLALGTAGPIARTVEDCALVFDVIADQRDGQDTASGLATDADAPLVIGVQRTPATAGTKVAQDNLRALDATVDALKTAGHTVREITLRHPDPTAAFVSQFFGGIWSEIRGLEHPERIEPRHRRTDIMGAWVTPAVERWALRWSQRFGQVMDEQLAGVDALLSPAVACRPAEAGKHVASGTIRTQLESLSSVAFAAQWNVSGHAAIVLPVGVGSDGLPVGVQLVGPRGEAALVQVARRVEQVLPHLGEQP